MDGNSRIGSTTANTITTAAASPTSTTTHPFRRMILCFKVSLLITRDPLGLYRSQDIEVITIWTPAYTHHTTNSSLKKKKKKL